MLERISARGKYLDCITSVHVFGSYSRGAVSVGDIDVSVSYDARLDPDVDAEVLDLLLSSRDWTRRFGRRFDPRARSSSFSTGSR
jgi:predicted nucleotidyltransferase